MRPIAAAALCSIALVLACTEHTGPDGIGPQLVSMNGTAPTVTITDLGTLGGLRSMAFAINEAGAIVGESETATGWSHAFLWEGGAMTDLGTLGGRSSYAVSVNARGAVVGVSELAGGGAHLVVWTHDTIHDLGTLGAQNVFPSAIGATGQIVGQLFIGGVWTGFSWSDGTLTLLPALPGGQSSADAVNPQGEIVGTSTVNDPQGNSTISSVLWKRDGSVIDLGTLGMKAALGGPGASGINPGSQVVGASLTAEGFLHAFLWRNGVMTDLGTLPGATLSAAAAISASGDIAGYVSSPTGPHAALWRAGTLIDLGTLSGDLESVANGINSHGQVVGWSSNAVRFRAVLWTIN
jgi:probable HAF family extracellular repeat protein